jgi:hypothetical protein
MTAARLNGAVHAKPDPQRFVIALRKTKRWAALLILRLGSFELRRYDPW